MDFSRTERLILANQCAILEALYPDEAAHYATSRKILESGYELHYDGLVSHISDEPFTREGCQEVVDILNMFSSLLRAYEKLDDKSEIDIEEITFDGFDGNNESEQRSYAFFFCKQQDSTRFDDLGNPGELNSHAARLETYRVMLSEFNKSEDRWHLTKDDILRIVKAVHEPAN